MKDKIQNENIIEMAKQITKLEKKVKTRSYLSLFSGCYGAINTFVALGFTKSLMVYAWLSTLPLLIALMVIIPILNRK